MLPDSAYFNDFQRLSLSSRSLPQMGKRSAAPGPREREIKVALMCFALQTHGKRNTVHQVNT